MKLITTIAKEKNFIKHQVVGLLNKAILLGKLEEIYSLPDFQPSMQVLWDLTLADFSAVEFGDIEEVASFVKLNWAAVGDTKVALVAPDSLGAMVTRKFAYLLPVNPESSIKIFQDYKGALLWLDKKLVLGSVMLLFLHLVIETVIS